MPALPRPRPDAPAAVSAGAPRPHPPAGTRTRTRHRRTRPWLLGLVLALLTGVAGGLLRVGIAPAPGLAPWLATGLAHAAVAHGFLMLCAGLGTVIGLERAVALGRPWGRLGPTASALAVPAVLAGAPGLAAVLGLLAALLSAAMSLALLRRQPAAHTRLLLMATGAWVGGALVSVLCPAGLAAPGALPAWLAFPVLTVAAERLEMTRLMRRHPGAPPALFAIIGALLAGAAGTAVLPLLTGPSGDLTRLPASLFGAALAALGAWLLAFDVARRTVRAAGLSRYMALCLLAGHAWLLVAGLAWAAQPWGLASRDLALHALTLGFLVSMMMGHAPVILPAVAGIKLQFGRAWYLPLAALHASLLWRVAGPAFSAGAQAQGAAANALALAVFGLTVVGAAWRWGRRHPQARG